MENKIRQFFGEKIELQLSAADSLSVLIADAGARMVDCLLHDGKILLCATGGSVANALHFSSAMLNHLEVDRPAFPLINLATNGFSADSKPACQVFARQIQALGQERDLLVILTATGHSEALSAALIAAQERGMRSIVLSGKDGGKVAGALGAHDLELRVGASNLARIRELHLFMVHCFCDIIESALFGQMTE